MIKNGLIRGTNVPLSKVTKCDSCILGKQTRTPIPKKREEGPGHKATRKLEKVWVDLAGPHPVQSQSKNEYTMDIIDDYTDMAWSIPLKTKDQAFDELVAWERRVETESGLKVGIYNIDNGELKSDRMRDYLRERGTTQRFTSPYTSAHNGRVERLHRTLMAKARTMRIYARCPTNLWDEFYLTALYLHTRTAIGTIKDSTPFERWYERKPDY